MKEKCPECKCEIIRFSDGSKRCPLCGVIDTDGQVLIDVTNMTFKTVYRAHPEIFRDFDRFLHDEAGHIWLVVDFSSAP
ncbi:MAG: hypothetical protein OXR66_07250 [Candidatus Woesearchaeota archaeon]|nr:hypothetical protein [Candidatus Woesearchaeota archaeon]